MMTYIVVLVRRGKDDRERRKREVVTAINMLGAKVEAEGRNKDVPGWRVVRVSEGGYH